MLVGSVSRTASSVQHKDAGTAEISRNNLKTKKTKIYYHDTEMSWHLHKTNGTFFEGLYFSDPEQRLGSSVVSND